MKIQNLRGEPIENLSGSNRSIGLLAPVLLLVFASVLGPANRAGAQYGPADRVGQALENTGRSIRRGVQNAVEASRGAVPVVVYEQPLVARVQARLQWEKLLAGSTVELEVRDDGTAILRGEVASKEAKERAFLLARDTMGINQVVDELVVPTSLNRPAPGPSVNPEGAEPLPPEPAVSAPPLTGPAAIIRVRPSRVRGRLTVGATTVVVQPPRVVVPSPAPVVVPVPAPDAAEVIVKP